MTPRPATGLLALLLLVLALAGCSGGTGASDASGGAVGPAAEDTAVDDGGAGGGGAGGGGAGDEAGGEAGGEDATGARGEPVSFDAGRRVVRTELVVAVEDVARAAGRVRDAALAAGGVVESEQTVLSGTPEDGGTARLELRVPVERTAELVADVAGTGRELSRTTSSEDVEGRLVDLESREATAERSVARVRELLDRATSLEDVVRLEAELARREADLESLQAQRAALADRAARSVVVVDLVPEGVDVVASGAPGFLDGLRGGWQALVASTGVVLAVVGALLPFAVLAAVLAAAALPVWRRRRRRVALAQP